ncbi:MAG: recombinase RecA [Candidatus Dojkabacteria bacterium]|jgi:recombination protein RecA|nr:recombinase RecA [Candidatus Dojkabacteria bacterium]MDD4561363.1 recombinase RecA [Candidatus Dojkabacteria bacterium]NLB12268.1 recombinase RecA [Candidatus Dojkabacteria bacterium]
MTTTVTKKKPVSSNENSSKKKAIEMAISQIEKQFGKGSIMQLGGEKKVDVDVIPTGALSLDIALGIGGIPKGRIVEIYGPEASGKTTLAIHILTEAQKQGESVAFIDAEHAFDPTYAKNIGLNLDEMYISQPDFGEQALEILETLVRSAAFGVIVVDSVAALTPRAEIEGEMGDSHMGLQARLMSQALRKLTAISNKTGTTIIFLNQLRMKIGIMFGNPETTTGGNALKFYSSVRLDIRQKEKILKDGKLIGHTRKVKVVKNKMAPPFKEATFDMIYPKGIDKESSILDAATELGIVKKSGSWFKYGEEQLAQGREATAELLREDKKLKAKIVKEVKSLVK